MDREIWIRAGMFTTVIVLVALILVTPNLLGHPSPLASLPVLIVAMTPDKLGLVIDVTAGVQPYMYRSVLLAASLAGGGNTTLVNETGGNWTYSASLRIPANGTSGLPANGSTIVIHARLIDQDGNLFEDNVTVTTSPSANAGVQMLFRFPDDLGTAPIIRTSPDDLRWAIPRRGAIPGTG